MLLFNDLSNPDIIFSCYFNNIEAIGQAADINHPLAPVDVSPGDFLTVKVQYGNLVSGKTIGPADGNLRTGRILIHCKKIIICEIDTRYYET